MWGAIPILYRVLAILAVLGAIAGGSWVHGDRHGVAAQKAEDAPKLADLQKMIDDNQHDYDERVRVAAEALSAENAANRLKEQTAAIALFHASEIQTREKTNDQAQTAAAVAAYRDGRQRMRVDITPVADAGGRCAMPGAPAAAGGPDGGTATAELSREAAGRVESVGGDANQVVFDLRAARAVISAYYAACGPRPAAGHP